MKNIYARCYWYAMNINKLFLVLCFQVTLFANFLLATSKKENLKLQIVIDKALQYASLNPKRLSFMKSRIRHSALMPKFKTIIIRDIDVDESVKEQVGDADMLYQKKSNDWKLMWYAEWDFSKLIFHPSELNLEKISFQAFNLRSKLIYNVIQKYFERKLLIAKLKIISTKIDRLEYQISLEKNTAELNAFTGGWFSLALKK